MAKQSDSRFLYSDRFGYWSDNTEVHIGFMAHLYHGIIDETTYEVEIGSVSFEAARFKNNVDVDVGTSYSATFTALLDGVPFATKTVTGKHSRHSNIYHMYDYDSTTLSGWEPTVTISREHADRTHTVGLRMSYTYNGLTVTTGDVSVREITIYVPDWGSSVKRNAGTPLDFSVQKRPSYTVTYDANGGAGAPSSQTKWHDEDLTLSSSKPTRAGYGFVGWATSPSATSATYQAGGTYTANAAITLYAVWTAVPTISSISVVRCDASGNPSDLGTYCKVTAQWSVDRSRIQANVGTVTGTVGSTVITWSSGASGASGTAVAIVPNVDTDVQYTVTVRVTDSFPLTTTRTDILTRAKFVWDVKAGGEAMGIGSAAPQKGLEVGWESQFDENVTLLKNLVVGGSLTAPELTVNTYSSGIVVAATNGTVVSQSARVVGHLCTVYVGLRPANSVSAGSTVTLGTLQSGFRPALTQGFASTAGTGTVSSGGSISFRPFNALSTSSTVYVGLTFLT